MTRIAVIGLGKMGLLHAGIHSALEGSPIVAAAERDGLILRLGRKVLPNLNLYEDYGEMIEKEDLDGIVVTTPIDTHAMIALDILEKWPDLGIFVEKPLAANFPDAERVSQAAQRRNSVHMVGFQKRFAATFRKAKELLDGGELGAPLWFGSHWFVSDIFGKGRGWRFRRGSGGVTLDAGPHLFDLLIWYFGEPVRVSAHGRSIYSEEVEDFVHCSLEFNDSLLGYSDLSWSVPDYRLPELLLEIHCENGVLTVNDDYLTAQLNGGRDDSPGERRTFRRPELQPSVPFLLGDPEFTLEDEAFRSAVSHRQPVEPNFVSAAKVSRVLDQVLDSVNRRA